MNERIERCETCRFWDQWDEREPAAIGIREWTARFEMQIEESKIAKLLETLGKTESDTWENPDCNGCCRARSPQLPGYQPDEDSVDPCKGCWPFTSPSDWCGEWQPTQPAAADTDAAE